MQTRRNLLIICEGSHTEPEYFHQLRDELIDRQIPYTIQIRPKPPAELKAEEDARKKVAEEAGTKARPGGKRRQMKNGAVTVDEFMVEEQYLGQPTRYVREAQLGIADGTFDEAWAVYDQDGHARHTEAVALATQNPREFVHVGFSSVAFEHWLLLHFEYNDTAFAKSECRRGREYFGCGTNTHADDCGGARCLAGYMKNKGYIPADNSIKKVGYKDLAASTETALRHAFDLRKIQLSLNQGRGLYEINPIVTVDRLVLKLLKEPMDLVWAYGQPLEHQHCSFTFNREQQEISLTITNTANAGRIFQEGQFILLDVTGSYSLVFERFMVDSRSRVIKTLDLNTLLGFEPVYAGILLEENRFRIVEF